MSKAVIVGERSLILGFKGVGFETVGVDKSEKLGEELMKLARQEDISLVLVTESMAAEAPQALKDFREQCTTILTTIPTQQGSEHIGFKEMKASIEYSIGVDMLGKE